MKKLLTVALLLLTLTPTVFAADQPPPETPVYQDYVNAQVNEVHEQKIEIDESDPAYDPNKPGPQYSRIQDVTYEVLEGQDKGLIFSAKNEIEGRIFDLDLKKGDHVIVLLKQYADGSYEGFATDYARSNTMIIFVVLFMLSIIAIGKWRGLRALISLILTVAAIFLILIPYSIQGANPLVLSIIISIVVTFVTIVIISGFNRKAASAIIGTIGGLLFAALIAYIVGRIGMLTGLSGEDARMLYINRPDLDFGNIFFASIVIGALGAVMDVGMSISSSVTEIAQANPKLGPKELFKSGMNVGKDIMGTMSNTLILAYVGSAFPLLMLFYLNQFAALQVINFDFMAAEIVRSISGSFGLLLAIPITALVCSIFTRR